MVEEPEFTYRLDVTPKAPKTTNAAELQEAEVEATMVKGKPITSKIRTTIRYLVERAGWLSRWRGLSVFVVYAIAHSLTKSVLAFPLMIVSFGQPLIAHSLASLIASVALVPVSTTWVHIVISEPSPKRWWQRIPPMSTWKHVWVATVIVDVVTRLSFLIPLGCATLLGLLNQDATSQHPALFLFKLAICGALGLITLVSLVVPSIVVLVRMQASLLPEEHESIVPFDRTYGGKVVPQILGGTGAISFTDAWKTFGMAARWRIVKLFFKFIAIEVVLHVVFGLLLAGNIVAMIGVDNIRKALEERRKHNAA